MPEPIVPSTIRRAGPAPGGGGGARGSARAAAATVESTSAIASGPQSIMSATSSAGEPVHDGSSSGSS